MKFMRLEVFMAAPETIVAMLRGTDVSEQDARRLSNNSTTCAIYANYGCNNGYNYVFLNTQNNNNYLGCDMTSAIPQTTRGTCGSFPYDVCNGMKFNATNGGTPYKCATPYSSYGNSIIVSANLHNITVENVGNTTGWRACQEYNSTCGLTNTWGLVPYTCPPAPLCNGTNIKPSLNNIMPSNEELIGGAVVAAFLLTLFYLLYRNCTKSSTECKRPPFCCSVFDENKRASGVSRINDVASKVMGFN